MAWLPRGGARSRRRSTSASRWTVERRARASSSKAKRDAAASFYRWERREQRARSWRCRRCVVAPWRGVRFAVAVRRADAPRRARAACSHASEPEDRRAALRGATRVCAPMAGRRAARSRHAAAPLAAPRRRASVMRRAFAASAALHPRRRGATGVRGFCDRFDYQDPSDRRGCQRDRAGDRPTRTSRCRAWSPPSPRRSPSAEGAAAAERRRRLRDKEGRPSRRSSGTSAASSRANATCASVCAGSSGQTISTFTAPQRRAQACGSAPADRSAPCNHAHPREGHHRAIRRLASRAPARRAHAAAVMVRAARGPGVGGGAAGAAIVRPPLDPPRGAGHGTSMSAGASSMLVGDRVIDRSRASPRLRRTGRARRDRRTRRRQRAAALGGDPGMVLIARNPVSPSSSTMKSARPRCRTPSPCDRERRVLHRPRQTIRRGR